MKKSRIFDATLLCTCATVLLFGGVGLCVFPAPRYSAQENRLLAAFPQFTAHSLRDGSYTASLDNYASERVPFRGIFRGAWSTLELAALRKEAHGVILCRDGSLCRRITANENVFMANRNSIARIQKLFPTTAVTVAVAPRRIDMRAEVLPVLYDTARERAEWEDLGENVLTFEGLDRDACWYRTDHHWSCEGAYLAYTQLGAALGYTPYPASDFQVVTVSESFLGTSANACGYPHVIPDSIRVWRFVGDEEYRLTRDGKQADFKGFYDLQKCDTADQYSLFLGGNCGVCEIDLGDNDTRPLLFVIKDSFANSLLPFLARHYRILAVDPRYFPGSIHPLAENAEHVLVLCGMQTLQQSPFLSAIK